MLRELSLHPVHLTPDREGNLPPSALVPFCSYQGESSLLGRELPELNNISVCDAFQSTILEGQLCFSLDVGKMGVYATQSGKSNGLFLLLDPSPYYLKQTGEGDSSVMGDFKISIHTLDKYTTSRSGFYGMRSLKKMTGTKSFERLPDHQKNCQVHKREECQARKYLEHVIKECNCVPWAQQTKQVTKRDEIRGDLFAGLRLLWSRAGKLSCEPNVEE